jgi:hypothetical protein
MNEDRQWWPHYVIVATFWLYAIVRVACHG